MRKPLLIVAVSICTLCGDIRAPGSYREQDPGRLIRRVYFEYLGVVPVIQELDWYCSHNVNSYEVAVRHVARLLGKDESFCNELLSKEYIDSKRPVITKTQRDRILCYLAGVEYSVDNVAVARKLLIEYSVMMGDNDISRIDQLCLSLLSRVSSVDEANKLLDTLKSSGWMGVLDDILSSDSFREL